MRHAQADQVHGTASPDQDQAKLVETGKLGPDKSTPDAMAPGEVSKTSTDYLILFCDD